VTQRILSLVEFLTACFEKQEVFDGWACREWVWHTRELAYEQFCKLTSDAIALFGEDRAVVSARHAMGTYWPNFRIGVSGHTVAIHVKALPELREIMLEPDADWSIVNADDNHEYAHLLELWK
jgi:hypothetical protein